MPETKFTPGPWEFDRDIWWENTPGEQEKHGGLVVYPADNPNGDHLTIAEVNDYFDREVGRANANLIAAAPCLYAALENTLAQLMQATKLLDSECTNEMAEAWRNGVSALRKARGAS